KTISLDDRVSFINRYLNTENDLLERAVLISIHANAAVSSEARGIEILYANESSAELAKVIANTLGRDFFVRRNIMGKFYLLSRVPIPGVIIETGFLTNEEDRKLLLSEEFQNKLIEKIIKALENYTKGEK
ncbi:MAG TPA: N-acetylmuramoyl-L-alanine amidase, partial [Dictyoglomaceae bacterium]|nr:N-acetylmuramoyl-L-alanine amidase [Dictyoglomaceae bacterium]